MNVEVVVLVVAEFGEGLRESRTLDQNCARGPLDYCWLVSLAGINRISPKDDVSFPT